MVMPQAAVTGSKVKAPVTTAPHATTKSGQATDLNLERCPAKIRGSEKPETGTLKDPRPVERTAGTPQNSAPDKGPLMDRKKARYRPAFRSVATPESSRNPKCWLKWPQIGRAHV